MAMTPGIPDARACSRGALPARSTASSGRPAISDSVPSKSQQRQQRRAGRRQSGQQVPPGTGTATAIRRGHSHRRRPARDLAPLRKAGHHLPREQLHRTQLLVLRQPAEGEVAPKIAHPGIGQRLYLRGALVRLADKRPLCRQVFVGWRQLRAPPPVVGQPLINLAAHRKLPPPGVDIQRPVQRLPRLPMRLLRRLRHIK